MKKTRAKIKLNRRTKINRKTIKQIKLLNSIEPCGKLFIL